MKKRYRTISLLLAGLVLVATSACSGGTTSPAASTANSKSATASAEGGPKKIALLMASLTTDFFVQIEAAAQKYAKEKNVQLTVFTCDNDAAKELSNMEDIVGQKPDLILFTPVDSAAAVASVEKANAAGIPVVTFDRGANGGKVVSHIASDNAAGGKMAADYIKQRFPNGANVVELQGILSTDVAKQRGAGFDTALKEAPNMKLVAQQSANFDKSQGMTVFENVLQANDKIDAVFAQNDEMALGAMQAAQAAGRTDIVIVGFDASPEAVKAIQDGKMAATIAQLPDKIIQTAIDTSLAYLAGETVKPEIGIELKLITK